MGEASSDASMSCPPSVCHAQNHGTAHVACRGCINQVSNTICWEVASTPACAKYTTLCAFLLFAFRLLSSASQHLLQHLRSCLDYVSDLGSLVQPLEYAEY